MLKGGDTTASYYMIGCFNAFFYKKVVLIGSTRLIKN